MQPVGLSLTSLKQNAASVKMRVSGHLHVRVPLVDCQKSACRLPGSREGRCAVGVGSVGGGRHRRVGRLGARVDAAAGDRWEEAPLPPSHVDYISSVTNPYVKHCVKLKKRCGLSPHPLCPRPPGLARAIFRSVVFSIRRVLLLQSQVAAS